MESAVNSIAKRYAELSQGVNNLTNENESLPLSEYEEFLELNEQLAGLFPSLTRNYDENGNAILGLSGSVDSVTESIKALVEQEKELAKAKIREDIEQYFDGTDDADGAWKALEGKKQALEDANKELAYLKDTYYELVNSNEKVTIGRFSKDFVNAEKKEYIDFIKSNFGEDIANAIEDAISINIGKGMAGQSADLIVDFSKLELTDPQKEQITKSYDTFYSELLAKQKTAMSEFESQNSEFSNNAMLWLEDLSFYKDSDKYTQTAIQNIVRNIDWSNYDFKELDYEGVKRILQDSVLTPFQIACEDPITKKSLDDALKGLFTMDTSNMTVGDITSQVDSYINTIATAISAISEDPTELKIKFGFDDTDTQPLINNVKEKLQDDFDDKVSELTLKELQIAAEQVEVPESTLLSWDELITKIEEAKKLLSDDDATSLSITKTIDQLNTQLKPAFDSLQSAYKDIFDDDGKFQLNSIDILSTCDSIKSKLDELNKIEGITVDYTAFEDFVRVLNNTESTEQDVETAFDSLATSITQAALTGAEDFETMKSALEDLGVANSEMVAFDALIKNTEALKEAGLDLSEATYDDIEAFVKGIGITENYSQAVNLLKIQKILCAENPLSTTADIQNLYNLAQAAGIATNAIRALMTLNTAYTKASAEGNTLAATAVKGQMEFVKKQVMDQFANLGSDVDFSNIGGGTKSAGKAGSSAGDAYVDAFEEELKALEDLRNNGLISEKEYLDRLRVLYERYFKDKLGYEKEFAKYQKQYLDGYKSLYESIFSHATKLIGDRIDLIEDEKDKAIDALEAQKKAAEDSYNAQIKLLEDKKKALQDEIDKINEANKDREEAIDLQEKERNLARAESQKTIRQYTEDRGFIYTTDGDAIRDAKNELESAKSDAEIRKLEKQQDALDKQIDSIQEMLDASNEYWDAQIEQTEKYYDTIIKGMEEYKSRWEELSDLQEHAEIIALLKELGLTEEDLLNESSGAFDRLRTSYLGILKDLNTGNQGVLDGLSKFADIDMSNIPSFLSEMQGYIDSISGMDVTALSDGLNDVSDGFSNIADSASSAASAISGSGTSTAKPKGNASENVSQESTSNTGNGSSLTEAIGKLAQDGVQEVAKISDAFAGEDGEGTSVTGAIQKVIDKVGSADAESGDSESLMSTLSEQTTQALDEENGIPAQKTAWEEMNTPLNDAVDSITTLQSTLEDMDGKEFTVTLNMIGNAASLGTELLSKFATSDNAKVEGTADIKGTANAQGNWGIKESGRTLVGELGQELWVHSKDGTFETVGDNGAEFINPEKGDIIFNHLQTRQLLDKGNIISRGKAYAEGSALVNGNVDSAMVQAQRPYDMNYWERMEKCAAALGRTMDEMLNPLNSIAFDIRKETGIGRFMENINNISNINNVNNNKNSQVINQEIHVTLPNVTNSTSADELLKDLQTLGYKKYEFV